MKIAFVNDWFEHLGVEHISAVLKQGGHGTKLFVDPQFVYDGNFLVRKINSYSLDRKILLEQLRAYQPDLVAFPVFTDLYQWALTVARMIKSEMDVPIIFGGIHPTSVPERVIANDCVDMVCVGEGEYPMLELADSMQRGSIDVSIKNIWFKKDGQVIANDVRPLIEDLDTLPMPDKELYYAASPHFIEIAYFIMTSRGCHNQCSYCSHSFLRKLYSNKGRYLRHRTIDNFIGELAMAKERYNMKFVRFYDDDFLAGRSTEWLVEFTALYKEKINLPFICYLYPKNVSSTHIDLLKEAGCYEIVMGIQTWDEDFRAKTLYRAMTNREIERIVGIINKKRINLSLDFIYGIPGQTEEEILEFINFYKRMKVNNLNLFGLRYFPKVDLTVKIKEKGYLTPSRYEELVDNLSGNPFNYGGDVLDGRFVRFKILFILARLLPRRLLNYIIEKRIYRSFPTFIPYKLLDVLHNSLMFTFEKRIVYKWQFAQYKYFLANIFRLKKSRIQPTPEKTSP